MSDLGRRGLVASFKVPEWASLPQPPSCSTGGNNSEVPPTHNKLKLL